MAKDLLKASEAAEYLGCGVSTLWRWASKGDVPKPIKIGGLSRWRKSELEGVLEAASAKRAAETTTA